MSRPVVVQTYPVASATSVSIIAVPYAIFDQLLYTNSVNSQTVQLLGPNAIPVAGAITYDSSLKKVTFTPTAALAYSTIYQFVLVGDANITDTVEFGIMNLATPKQAMAGTTTVTFTTEAAPTPVVPTTPTPTDTQLLVSSVPVNEDILVPLDFTTHDHKATLNFLFPIPLTQTVLKVTGNSTGVIGDLVIAGVTGLNSAAGVLTWEITSVTVGITTTYYFKLYNSGAEVACATTLVGGLGTFIPLVASNSSGIFGSIKIIGSTGSGTATIDYAQVPLYGNITFTGVDCIGLFGASHPEMTGDFWWPNAGRAARLTPDGTIDIRVSAVDRVVTLEFGHYIEDPDNVGTTPITLIWENLDLNSGYQWVITILAGVASFNYPNRVIAATAATGGTLANGTYTWKCTAVTASGESAGSAPSNSITISGSSKTAILTFPRCTQVGVLSYKIYRSLNDAGYCYIGTTTQPTSGGITFTDTGLAATTAGVPTTNNAWIIYPISVDNIIWFVTIPSPMYATLQIIRLNIGPYIRSIPNDTIIRFIYEVSYLVRRMYYEQHRVWLSLTDLDSVPAAVIQWVICKAKLDALDAAYADYTGSGSGIRKTLGDFTVERSGPTTGSPISGLRSKYEKCLEVTGRELNIDYNTLVAVATVMAEYDPRRPITDWSWRRWPESPSSFNQTGKFPETSPSIVRSVPPDLYVVPDSNEQPEDPERTTP
jgi:hypothetical protein